VKLPPPFQDATSIKPNAQGSLDLIDAKGKTLAQVALHTALDLGLYQGRVTCKDGFSVSVRASATHYCRPRKDHGPWTHYELGFPNQPDDLIQAYAENSDDPTDTVYAYVPHEILRQLIQTHGGIASIDGVYR